MKPLAIYRDGAKAFGDGRPFIYASVNTLNHRPLLLARHLEIAAASYQALYGLKPSLDQGAISAAIGKMLAEGGYPTTGNIVDIFLSPNAGEPELAICHSRSTIYRGYELLSLKAKAVITNYDIPFGTHRTAISRMAAAYMDDFAVRNGANLALRANRSGNLISSGDSPLFVGKDKVIFTPPAMGDSVEKELMKRVCAAAGIPIEEKDIPLSMLPDLDEIMVFTPSGIQNAQSCNGLYFLNLLGLRLEKYLPALTK